MEMYSTVCTILFFSNTQTISPDKGKDYHYYAKTEENENIFGNNMGKGPLKTYVILFLDSLDPPPPPVIQCNLLMTPLPPKDDVIFEQAFDSYLWKHVSILWYHL